MSVDNAASLPGVASKNGFSRNPRKEATKLAGKVRTDVLYVRTVSLNRRRSTATRFSMLSS